MGAPRSEPDAPVPDLALVAVMAIHVNERMARYRERKRAAQRAQRAPGQRLTVTCWCEATTLEVPARDVRRGLTGSCGARACRAAA